MLRNPNVNRRINLTPPGLKSPDLAQNIANESLSSNLNPFFTLGGIEEGIVIRSGVGSYDAIVKCNKQHDLPCVTLQRCLSILQPGYGNTEATIYPEGTLVIFYRNTPNMGVILGVKPITISKTLQDPQQSIYVSPVIQYEGGVSPHTDDIYKDTLIDAANMRPLDILPGNNAEFNEQLISTVMFNLLYCIKGSELAKMEFFTLDDLIRVVSRNYQHKTATWQKSIYSDYGYNTEEIEGSPYWFDMIGLKDFGVAAFQPDTYDKTKEHNMAIKPVTEGLRCRARYKSFTGFLGGVYSFFVAVPPTSPNTSAYGDNKADSGVFHTHISGSGQLMVRSAGGILLERCDRIQVPNKIKEPWDPSGNKVEDTSPFELRKLFEWDSKYRYSSHLQLRDYAAYFTKASYQRFMELNKDWYLPLSESLVPLPENIYEKVSTKPLAEDKLTDYEALRSFINMGKDGSIIIRDASGAEIALKGGNIVLTCPGNIEVRSGKSTVVMGGNDVILKGKENIDISATNKDLRIKAEKNLQIYSNNGILIESGSTADTQDYKDKTGGQIISNGIILKAINSRIFQWANTIHFSFVTDCLFEAFKAAAGGIRMMASNIKAYVTNSFNVITKRAGISIDTSSAVLYGTSVYSFGSNVAGLFEGDKYLAPVDKVAISQNPYKDIHTRTEVDYNKTWNDGKMDSTLGAYDIETRADIKFKFRTSAECGTLKPSEVYKGGDAFVIYESAWSLMKKDGSTFIEGDIDVWKELPVNDTYPWPGSEQYKTCLVRMVSETNWNKDDVKELSKVTASSGALEVVSLDELAVIKNT